MQIQFWSIGKKNEPYVDEGVALFTKRISHYYKVDWKIIPTSKNAAVLTSEDLKVDEGKIINNLLHKEDYLILLDERGKNLHSEDLANLIQQRTNDSTKQIIFLIGGAYGVSNDVLTRANFKWSLSNLVFPHQLVRLILAEQVYRACTINKNEKYHHQ
ncbi:MAG: 23S rRNA (pseudouridine(1915)-N(3))-methyltransferase RlmH [Chitinophagaceae bacterium]|nr:23S rRNA (pseudouridine(1915)-N(3))-methyltransferase RlmH [Chitinophagaceae bacterium]